MRNNTLYRWLLWSFIEMWQRGCEMKAGQEWNGNFKTRGPWWPWIAHLNYTMYCNAKHIKTIILNATSTVLTILSFIWPSDLYFLPDMTHIPTWTRYHQDNILTKFQLAQSKNAASGVWTIFSFIDLVFDPIWPIFELDLDIIQTNILTKFQAAEAKTVASKVLTRFSFNLA